MGRFTHRTHWTIDGHFHDDAQAEAFLTAALPHLQRAIDATIDEYRTTPGFLDVVVLPVASIEPHPFRDTADERVPDGSYGGARKVEP